MKKIQGLQSPHGATSTGVPVDEIRLSLLSFSLFGEAKRWLHSFKGNSLKSRDEVVEKFLKKYFPESKTAEGKVAISSFHQFPDESLSEDLKDSEGYCGRLPLMVFQNQYNSTYS